MNISKINLKGTNYDIKDKLVRDSIGIPESENNSLGIAPLDASGKVPSENLPTIPQLPDLSNGHQYVDLGLPSGTLWATMNVGATSETDYGNYYMYGKGSKTYDSADSPYSGTEDPLDLSKDTARVVWGGEWRMPTRVQMQELIDNTTYQWVTNYKGSGINGGTFTATNGAVLFIPAAGFWYGGSQNSVGSYGLCWGSSPDGSSYACNLYFSNGRKGVYRNDRKGGFSVRPVIITSNTLHKVSVTGDYNDLSNKPTIPSIAPLAKQTYLTYITIYPEDCYFTYIALGDGTCRLANSDYYYSNDLGVTWNHITSSSTLINVVKGDIVLFKGTIMPQAYAGIGGFKSSVAYEVAGNIMSFLYGDNFRGQTAFPSNMQESSGFFEMFNNETKLKSAKHLILTASTVPFQTYGNMFVNCSNLVAGPIIAAETVVDYGCMTMFDGCSNISYINTRFRTLVHDNALSNWLSNVASKGIFIKNVNATWTVTGTSGVPDGWTVYYDYQH